MEECCCQKTKVRTDEEYKSLMNRLNRIEGQIRGLKGMLEKNAYCPDILTQAAAANAAVNAFCKELLADHIRTWCRGEYPRRERRGDRRACAHHAEAHEVKRSRKFIGKDGNDGTISSDRNELRGLQCPRGKSSLQGAGCDVVQCEPADELHGR